MPGWESWMAKLTGSGADDADDVVDELAARILSSSPDPSATPVVIEALRRGRSDLSCRTAALALAYAAGDTDLDAPDALDQAFSSKAKPRIPRASPPLVARDALASQRLCESSDPSPAAPPYA